MSRREYDGSLGGLLAVKQLVKLWPEKAFGWRQTLFLFLRTEPFSLRFPYIFRLLHFLFDTEYYAILMSKSFTLVSFRTLVRPLHFQLIKR